MYYLLVNKCINYGNYIYNLCVCCVVKGSCSVCSYHTSEMMSHCPLVFKQQNYIDILIDGAQNLRLGSNFYFVSFLLWLFFYSRLCCLSLGCGSPLSGWYGPSLATSQPISCFCSGIESWDTIRWRWLQVSNMQHLVLFDFLKYLYLFHQY